MSIIQILNNKILEIFYKLNYDTKYASFKYSDRPDISDFQTNCAMPLSKVLNKNPIFFPPTRPSLPQFKCCKASQ